MRARLMKLTKKLLMKRLEQAEKAVKTADFLLEGKSAIDGAKKLRESASVMWKLLTSTE